MRITGKWAIATLVVLVLSLSLNLFVAGFVGSRVYQWRQGGMFNHMVGAYVGHFPKPLRQGLREEMFERRPEMANAMRELHRARQDMFEMMRSDRLDRAQLDAAMSKVRERTSDLQQIGQSAVLDAIANADPQVRAAIAPPAQRGWFRNWRRHGFYTDDDRGKGGGDNDADN